MVLVFRTPQNEPSLATLPAAFARKSFGRRVVRNKSLLAFDLLRVRYFSSCCSFRFSPRVKNLSHAFSRACALFCNSLPSRNDYLHSFQAFPHSLPTNTGGWGPRCLGANVVSISSVAFQPSTLDLLLPFALHRSQKVHVRKSFICHSYIHPPLLSPLPATLTKTPGVAYPPSPFRRFQRLCPILKSRGSHSPLAVAVPESP
jgi:hypothetical protein